MRKHKKVAWTATVLMAFVAMLAYAGTTHFSNLSCTDLAVLDDLTLSDDFAMTGDQTVTGAITQSGGAVSMNASSNYAVSFATGTSTGTITLGGTGAQTITIGAGAAAKTVSLGSATGASSLTLNGGTGDVSITSVDDITINGGSAGSVITIGGNAHGNVLAICGDDTAADDIDIGSDKDDLDLEGEDITLDTADDMDCAVADDFTVTIESAGGIFAVAGTAGSVINIGTDNTTKDTITIGSAKDDVVLVSGAGAEAASGNVASERCVGAICQTVMTLTAVSVTITDPGGAAAYGGTKIYDFPEGYILALGLVADITATEASATIVDDWDGDISFGTTAADSTATLHNPTTEDDWALTAATTQAVSSVAACDTASAIAAQVYHDGTATAKDLYINFEIDDADISTGGADAITVDGTVTVTWINLGDN